MGGKAAVILVIGFGFVFGYIAVRINTVEGRAVDNTAMYLEVTTSHNIAVAGANVALSKLYQDTTIWRRDTILAQASFTDGIFAGGSYRVIYDYLGSDRSELTSYSQYSAYGRTFRDTVVVRFNMVGVFDILGLMVGFSGNDDTWITRDSMWGRVHFNGRVNVKGSPVYHDKITVSKGFSPAPGVGTNNAIFLNGYETGVAQLPLPSLKDTGDTYPAGDTVLYGDWTLLFEQGTAANDDGIFKARDALHDYSGPRFTKLIGTLGPPLQYDVILVRGNVSIKGVIDGRVTVAATGMIYIDDDVTYAVDPLTNPSSSFNDDMLGLVAGGDIVLYNPTPSYQSNKRVWNVYCIAASLNGQIRQEASHNANTYGAYVFKNYGGLMTPDRFNIAQYSNSASPPWPYINSGFFRRFRWDSRLGPPQNLRPPNFPIPEDVPIRLQIVNWWENVRIPEY